ncbi:MAG: glycosyltransferase family 4 protein [Bernardetiaceae bacterium]|nr:glycosyltransferase family 4 protein [Bernardetiaceae bacterium]
MRIAFFTHYTDLYGANRSMLSPIAELQRQNLEVTVILPNSDAIFEKELQELGVPFLVTEFYMAMQNRWYSRLMLKVPFQYYHYQKEAHYQKEKNKQAFEFLFQKLSKNPPDIIYTNSAVMDLGYDLAKALDIAHVWHLRELCKEDYNLTLPFKNDEEYYQKMANTPICPAMSQYIANHYTSKNAAIKTQVVYDGIATEELFESLKQKSQKKMPFQNSKIFAIVGLIQEKKGQHIAIKAMATVTQKYPDAQLWIVGDGNVLTIEKLIRQLGLEKQIKLWGKIDKVFDKIYLQSDATLMCSEAEAMGRVTVESMAAMRPLIGRNTAGTAELIADGRGFVYDGSSEDLARQMIFLIENSTIIPPICEKAQKWVAQNFTVEAYSQRMYEIFKSVRGLN